MARKKQLRYNDVVRNIAEMQALLTDRRRHMAEALAGALDDRTAAMLGDFSDAELRRVASLMFAHVGECVAQVKAEQRARQGISQPMAVQD